uniref:Ig-like domain-containing protein n=1 Tax=Neolamprologus brichardi TaxID=32507 RepID=A0A3Q4GZ49_NEOBR
PQKQEGLTASSVLQQPVSLITSAQTVKYIRVGGTLQLSPQQVSEKIYSVVWKYGKNLLAEWVKDQIPLTYYSKFKGRTTLNNDTGMLETRSMTAEDNGLYSVEINNQVQSQVHKIVVIEDVPQPEVAPKPLVCSPASKRCELVCEGDVSKAGPVEYFWKEIEGGKGEWARSEENTAEIIIDAETQHVETFSCRIKNQFSEKDSEAFKNPFYQEKKTDPTPSLKTWAVVLIALFVTLLHFEPTAVVLLCKLN